MRGGGRGASVLLHGFPLSGIPSFAATSDGKGPRAVALRVRTDAAGDESLGLFATDLRTPLVSLLGGKGRSDAFVVEGASLPAGHGLHLAGDDLVLALPGGATWTLQGAAPLTA